MVQPDGSRRRAEQKYNMAHQEPMLAAMAEIGALRRLTVQAIAMRLLEETAPHEALSLLGLQMTRVRSVPPEVETGLDPAVSDLLAAMTDERIQGLVGELGRALLSMTDDSRVESH